MKKIILALLILLWGCDKPYPDVDELLPPGTFNLSTIIVDANGNSLDLAGDWAVFQDPVQTLFTNFIHYDQTSETSFSVTSNTVFMMEYDKGRAYLPSYDHGMVNQPRSIFLQDYDGKYCIN